MIELRNRKCPICEEPISYSDFIRTNFKRNVDLSSQGIFFDERVVIPCCRCLNIIEKINDAAVIDIIRNPNHQTYHVKIKRDVVYSEIEIITILKESILRNLLKFGILK